MSALLSRKFLAAMFALASSSLLCWFGHISDGVYSAVVLGTVGAFVTANVLQKVNGKKDV